MLEDEPELSLKCSDLAGRESGKEAEFIQLFNSARNSKAWRKN
jgi:hypothetical protein